MIYTAIPPSMYLFKRRCISCFMEDMLSCFNPAFHKSCPQAKSIELKKTKTTALILKTSSVMLNKNIANY